MTHHSTPLRIPSVETFMSARMSAGFDQCISAEQYLQSLIVLSTQTEQVVPAVFLLSARAGISFAGLMIKCD